MMHVVRPVAQIVRGNLHKPFRLRFAEQTEVQHFKIFRENRHDIDLHNVQNTGMLPSGRKHKKWALDSNAHLNGYVIESA